MATHKKAKIYSLSPESKNKNKPPCCTRRAQGEPFLGPGQGRSVSGPHPPFPPSTAGVSTVSSQSAF